MNYTLACGHLPGVIGVTCVTCLQSELAAERAKVADLQSALERMTGERDAAVIARHETIEERNRSVEYWRVAKDTERAARERAEADAAALLSAISVALTLAGASKPGRPPPIATASIHWHLQNALASAPTAGTQLLADLAQARKERDEQATLHAEDLIRVEQLEKEVRIATILTEKARDCGGEDSACGVPCGFCQACRGRLYEQMKGWRDEAQTKLAEMEGRVAAMAKALQTDQSYSLLSVFQHLIDATVHLFKVHDCDTDGWEIWQSARDKGPLLLAGLVAALSPAPAIRAPGEVERTDFGNCPRCGKEWRTWGTDSEPVAELVCDGGHSAPHPWKKA